MMFPWKILLGPGLLLALKFGNVEYDKPSNLIVVRALYGVSQVFLLAGCLYIAYAIRQRGDEKKTVKISTKIAASGEAVKESQVTYKEYDMSELLKLAKNFILGAVVTVVIHYYMAVVPALILQIVTQPITLFEHALFSIYILNKDASKDAALKRPFIDKSPAATLEAMKQQASQETLKSSVSERKNIDTDQDTSTSGDSVSSFTIAEKRTNQSAAAQIKEE